MEQNKFTYEEVFLAYKKLKNYYYNDNTSLFIKQRIAEFEEEIEYGENFERSLSIKFKSVLKILNSSNSKICNYLREVIGCKVTPKSLLGKKGNLLTNRTNSEDILLDRINYFIDAPVEVHLISVLWITKIGVHLNKLIDEDNYAYKLEIIEDDDEKESLVNGFRIFKPYYLQYQSWRDNAIGAAEKILSEKKDAVILSLDVKDYFHSVRMNFDKLEEDLSKSGIEVRSSPKLSKLFDLVPMINEVYTDCLNGLSNDSFDFPILPIGLLSSGVLANYYLNDFDKKIKKTLNPVYYGRYVDDIMIVLTNTRVSQKSISPVNRFLNDYFVKRRLLSFDLSEIMDNFFFKDTNETNVPFFVDVSVSDIDPENVDYYVFLHHANQIKFKIKGYDSLRIQSSKVMLQDFHYNESPALINKFKKNIEKNRSEFRYLPNEDEIDKEFDEEAFSMQYNDSINKLRSVKEFREDKYGASKYLAAKIFTSSLTEKSKKNKKDNNQILTFFKGEIGIDFHTLWEKVATFFVVNNEHESLFKFFNKTRIAINNIRYKNSPNSDLERKIRQDLLEYLKISIAISIAYHLKFNLFKFSKINNCDVDIRILAESFRKANLFRNTWVSIPALNYTKYLSTEDFGSNLLERERSKINKDFIDGNLDLCTRSIKLAPRYVQFHEINILKIYQTLSSIKNTTDRVSSDIVEIPNAAFNDYWRINFQWKCIDYDQVKVDALRKLYFEIKGDKLRDENKTVRVFSTTGKETKDKKIALANVKMNPQDIELSFRNKANVKKERREQLFRLMNEVEKEEADIFVLPEVSIPCEWVTLLCHQSKKSNTCIIAGLEHWVNDAKIAFNLMAVVLPIEKGPYRTCLINLRLKNHYSPEENKLLKGNRLLVPRDISKDYKKVYTLFNWRGVYFSTYNCFELADIHDRALFKSKVDFIVASEYNRDIYYFSDIAGSWVRDLHCYFIQVNSSDFGDSRVLQPSSSIDRNILQIKGGENSSIIIGKLKIDKLREFQRKDHYLQKEDGTFKPTPPDFEVDNVEKRINNECIIA
ncbi:hypothetical protein QE382_002312 [Sphingobacterium zeae]|uniref:Reverse transcriptase domain-containing protein n=1 Tax=Sphingobacterium zeae TaxID=1776859 RepID=A0ABU0U7W5_9SPHI|nr:reverse transcriptase domain-containing protein [Sphingobacterium zeae]MDQ1150328.1 hypothetical protein [Sphingobacterium zeae]